MFSVLVSAVQNVPLWWSVLFLQFQDSSSDDNSGGHQDDTDPEEIGDLSTDSYSEDDDDDGDDADFEDVLFELSDASNL